MNTMNYVNTTNGPVPTHLYAAVLGAVVIVSLIFGLILFIMSALALIRMAKNAGIKKPWLAWIPFGNVWIMGELISEKLRGNGGLKYLLATLIYVVISFIPNDGTVVSIISLFVSIAFIVFSVAVTYWIFKKYSNRPVLHTVLSAIIPFYNQIVMIVIRDNEPR